VNTPTQTENAFRSIRSEVSITPRLAGLSLFSNCLWSSSDRLQATVKTFQALPFGTPQPIFLERYGVVGWLVATLKALSIPASRRLRLSVLPAARWFTRSSTMAIG
jgi:hypothetical protein